MRLPSRRPAAPELPGTVLRARTARRTSEVVAKLQPGELAVVSHADLDARTARALLERGVGAVLNAAPFVSGSHPNLGPQLLADADVLLLETDAAGAATVQDGARVRVHDGSLYAGEQELLTARVLEPDEVARQRAEAGGGLARQLEAFAHNSSAFLAREQGLLLHGEGLPALATSFDGRPVVVVAGGETAARQLDGLRAFVHEQHPLLVAVDDGAAVLRGRRLRPDVLVVTATALAHDVVAEADLRAAGEVVLHEGRADRSAVDRLARWGVEAHHVATDVDAYDVALLLAHGGDADLIVPAGRGAGFEEFLDRGRSDQASAFLTRLRVGSRLVEAAAVPRLYAGRVRFWQLLVIVLAALAALWLAVATTPIGNAWWHDVGDWLEGVLQR